MRADVKIFTGAFEFEYRLVGVSGALRFSIWVTAKATVELCSTVAYIKVFLETSIALSRRIDRFDRKDCLE